MSHRSLPAWIALLLCSLVLLAGCNRTELYSELNEHQANEIQAALFSAGIDSTKRRTPDGKFWVVAIPREHFAQAMQVMNANHLPRATYQSLGDVFKKEGIVSSPTEERARYMHALQQEMADTIRRIDGVIDARVSIALPERSPLQADRQSGSAAVVIIEQPGSNVRERLVDIQAILKDGVEGLDDPNRVTVKFFSGAAAVAPVVDGSSGSSQTGINMVTASFLIIALLVAGLAALAAMFWFNRQAATRRRQLAGRDDRAGA